MVKSKFVSRKCSFNHITSAKLNELKTKQIKKRSLLKIQWGVRAFQEWRQHWLESSELYDNKIFECNLDQVGSLTKTNLAYSLCLFLPEVTKVKDGEAYPGKTLYQMVIAIQRYLNEKGLDWKLIDGTGFQTVKVVLDNVMKECAHDNIGIVKQQAEVITYNDEQSLW